jgi:signal transduction histidine kinase
VVERTVSPQEETRILAQVSGALVLLVAVAALSQWASWGPGVDPTTPDGPGDAFVVFVATLLPGWAAVALVAWLRPASRGWLVRTAVVIGAAALASWLRLLILVLTRHHDPSTGFLLIEYAFATGATSGALVGGLLYLDSRERIAGQERLRAEHELRAARALADLEREELRVRRQVSGQLHGAVQQRLVVIGAELDDLAARMDPAGAGPGLPGAPGGAGGPGGAGDAARRMRELAAEVDELREEEVRRISHALFPVGADIGAFQAAQVMLQRLPGSMRTELTTGPHGGLLSDPTDTSMPVEDRLVVVAVVEEAVTNALRHGGARRVHVHGDGEPGAEPGTVVAVVTVDDDGSGPPAEPVLNGLARLRDRVAGRGGELTLGPGPLGGARVSLRLPVGSSPDDPAA